MNLRKTLIALFCVLITVLLTSCNLNTDLSFGDPEVPSADIDKPTEEVTQIPTEEPTEKPTEPIITIDGITFDKTLKTKLNAAKTYADICEILGKEGTLMEQPEAVYYWTVTQDSKSFPIRIKFKATEKGYVICEDVSVTLVEIGADPSKVPQEVLEQLPIGLPFEEVNKIFPINPDSFQCGMPIEYQWDFGENIKINLHFYNRIEKEKQDLSVMYIDFWDSESTNTEIDIFRTNLKLGQTVAELNELFGVKGRCGSPTHCVWTFADGTRLRIGCYLDASGISRSEEDMFKFNGSSRIY